MTDTVQNPAREKAETSRTLTARFSQWRRGISARMAFWAFLLGAVIAIVLSAFMYVTSTGVLTERELERFQASSETAANRAWAQFDFLLRDIVFLSKVPPIQAIIDARRLPDTAEAAREEAVWSDRLATIFTALMTAHPEYFQARYIGLTENGKEIVRVERTTSGEILRAPQDDLQSKIHRDYFQDTAKLAPGEIYISEVNLNQEFGRIEEPYRPTLRVAIPVFDATETLFGMLVLNIAASSLFDLLVGTNSTDFLHFITNQTGDYLYTPDGDKIFGFDLGTPNVIQDDLPMFAPLVAGESDRFSGLIDYQGTTYLAAARAIYFGPRHTERKLIYATLLPNGALLEQLRGQALSITVIALALISAGAVLAIIIARTVTHPLVRLTAATAQISRGERNIDISDLTGRGDETGRLARAATRMLDNIKEREGELVERVEDITQSHVEIERLNAKLAAALNTAIDGMIVIDALGTVMDFNPAAAKMFGYQPHEVLGQNVKLLMPEPDRSSHDHYLDNHARTGNKKIIGKGREVAARRKDGTVFPIDLSVSEMVVDGQNLFFGVTRDITNRKQEEEKKEANFIAELTRSNAELAQFAYIASHDLQEPLRMVSSYLNLLERRYKDQLDEEASEFIGYAVDGAARMKQLINDLLEYSRVSNKDLHVSRIDARQIVEKSAAHFAQRLEDLGGRIDIGPLPQVRADPAQFERLIINLIDNAIKYRSEAPPLVSISATERGGMQEFIVADNGIGIDPKFADKVFEIFTRLQSRDSHSGNGIGLASCKRIVERHGGSIWPQPAATRGTEFHFTLPSAEEETPS